MDKQLQAISLTQHAAARLKEMQKNILHKSWGLRFSLSPGLCGSGYEYVLDFTEFPQSDDATFYSQDIPIYVAKENLNKLQGSQIEFEQELCNREGWEGLQKFGFKILNPNVKGPCPCICDRGVDL